MYASIRLALCLLICSAPAVFAIPGLSLKISGSDTANGVDHMKVVVTVANTGDETLKLLNKPHSALHQSPTNTFVVTHESGRRPAFHGISAEIALVDAGEDAFTILGPGESINVSHDLSAAYDFTVSGEGSYTVEADNLFHYVDFSNNDVIPILAAGEVHLLMLSPQPSKARISSSLAAFYTFNRCNNNTPCGGRRPVNQIQRLNRAADASLALVQASLTYLDAHGWQGPLYRKWFGGEDDGRYVRVHEVYESMSQIIHTFDCVPCPPSPLEPGCVDANDNPRYAYVDSHESGDLNQPIHICPQFWDLDATGMLSEVSTLIHETSHLNRIGNTEDWFYGSDNCACLAGIDPQRTVQNADTYMVFSECVDAQNKSHCDLRCSRQFCTVPILLSEN